MFEIEIVTGKSWRVVINHTLFPLDNIVESTASNNRTTCIFLQIFHFKVLMKMSDSIHMLGIQIDTKAQ